MSIIRKSGIRESAKTGKRISRSSPSDKSYMVLTKEDKYVRRGDGQDKLVSKPFISSVVKDGKRVQLAPERKSTPSKQPTLQQKKQEFITPQEQKIIQQLETRDKAKFDPTSPYKGGGYVYAPLRTPEELQARGLDPSLAEKKGTFLVSDPKTKQIVVSEGTGTPSLYEVERRSARKKALTPVTVPKEKNIYEKAEEYAGTRIVSPVLDTWEKTRTNIARNLGVDKGLVLTSPVEQAAVISGSEKFQRSIGSYRQGITSELVQKPILTAGTFAVGGVLGAGTKALSVYKAGRVGAIIVGALGLGWYGASAGYGILTSPNPWEQAGRETIRFTSFTLGAGTGARLVKPTPTILAKGTLISDGTKGLTVTKSKIDVGGVRGTQMTVINQKGFGISQTKLGEQIIVSKITPKITTGKVIKYYDYVTPTGKQGTKYKTILKFKQPTPEQPFVKSRLVDSKLFEQQSITPRRTVIGAQKTKLTELDFSKVKVTRGREEFLTGKALARQVQTTKAFAKPAELKIERFKIGVTKQGTYKIPVGKPKKEIIPAKFVFDKAEVPKPIGKVTQTKGVFKLEKSLPALYRAETTRFTTVRGQFRYEAKPRPLISGKKAQVGVTRPDKSRFGNVLFEQPRLKPLKPKLGLDIVGLEQIRFGDPKLYGAVPVKTKPKADMMPLTQPASKFVSVQDINVIEGLGVDQPIKTKTSTFLTPATTQRVGLREKTSLSQEIGVKQKTSTAQLQRQSLGLQQKIGTRFASKSISVKIPRPYTPTPVLFPFPKKKSDEGVKKKKKKKGSRKGYVPSIAGLETGLKQTGLARGVAGRVGFAVRGRGRLL